MKQSSPQLTKIGADGSVLDASATEWDAVLDSETGLMWPVKVIKVPNWKKAEPAAKKCTAAGFSDYFLPTRKQLLSIVDDTRVGPAINTDYFPGCPSDWFWTSTPFAGASPGDCAWGVVFSFGGAGWGFHDGNGFVRAVRVGECHWICIAASSRAQSQPARTVARAQYRAVQSVWSSYVGHFSHASSVQLQQRLRAQFPWLRRALMRRHFASCWEGRSLSLRRGSKR